MALIALRYSRILLFSTFSLLVSGSMCFSAPPRSEPTQAQIDCQNQAVNDYWANMKSCEQNLSDLPDQLALCQSDARADLDRSKAACLASRTLGTRNPELLKRPFQKLEVAPK